MKSRFRFWCKRDSDSGINSGGSSVGTDNQSDTENNQNDVTNTNNDSNQTYTKEQYDNALKRAKKQAENQILKELGIKDINSAKENINKYLESIEKDKTDLQKANDKVKNANAEVIQLKAENNMLMLVNKSLMAGVNPGNAEDFAAIVGARMNEENDADDVIEELKKNPAYIGFFKKENIIEDNNNKGTGYPLGKQKGGKGESINYGKALAEKFYGKNKNKSNKEDE